MFCSSDTTGDGLEYFSLSGPTCVAVVEAHVECSGLFLLPISFPYFLIAI